MVGGARQRLQFFGQDTGFSKTIELCSNLGMGFCIN